MLESWKWTRQTVEALPGAPLSARRLHPKVAGIYFLIDNGELQYIGSSINLQARLSCHRSYKKLSREATVKWLILDPEREILGLEHELIYLFRPPKNVTMNPDSSKVQSYVAGQVHSVWVKRIVEKMTKCR